MTSFVRSLFFGAVFTVAGATAGRAATATPSGDFSTNQLQAVFDAVKTPYKYGVVLAPASGGVDCPSVFHQGNWWYMTYYSHGDNAMHLAESVDLINWQPMRAILPRSETGKWDAGGAIGNAALVDMQWGATNELQMLKKHYWMSYAGGTNPDVPNAPLDFGIALTPDPGKEEPWKRLPVPVLRHGDTNARPFETAALTRSQVFFSLSNSLGMPFVMFYSARSAQGDESIGVATSRNLKNWKRIGEGPVLSQPRAEGSKASAIITDPEVMRMDDLWVMFYRDACQKTNTFNTFAVSRDLTNWAAWPGEPLVRPSEVWDAATVGRPWVIKQDGVVYHYYFATGTNGQRVIALATSKDLRTRDKK